MKKSNVVLFKMMFLLALTGCADLTKSGAKVRFVEHAGPFIEMQEMADRMVAKNNCDYVGIVDAKTALFPGSYSVHDNEIHTALRNRAAKIGANLVIANFYLKPARGIGLFCI
jgi:TPP-dependent indolepyruvate ferredoxin oxidoreductase alpha subunit